MSRRSDPVQVAAVDLGASSGRVMLGRVGRDDVSLLELRRFGNGPVYRQGRLRWDITRLVDEVVAGVAQACRHGGVSSIGIDSWAVDYGIVEESGAVLADPVHYRDARTQGIMDRVMREVGADELYRVTGIQFQPFNTIYQLLSESPADLGRARHVLLIPDLVNYLLTGVAAAELTNASTTQLVDIGQRDWSADLMRRVGLDRAWLPDIRPPGTVLAPLLPAAAASARTGEGLPVVMVASHDTASAVVAVPAVDRRFAFISCGTWSLVGVELDRPVLTPASRTANFTNETGVDGTVRYLRNVMGLWLLQECLRSWGLAGDPAALADLLTLARKERSLTIVIDPDRPQFLPPGDMPARIAEECRRTGQPQPASQAAVVRCILDSLAVAYRRAVTDAVRLSGRDVDVVHIVGGGSSNDLLCQLTADACGLPVVAGPTEAAGLGNALLQGRALGAVDGTLADMRRIVARSIPTRRYFPERSAMLAREWERAECLVMMEGDWP